MINRRVSENATMGVPNEIILGNIDRILELARECESWGIPTYEEVEQDDFVLECRRIRAELHEQKMILGREIVNYKAVGKEIINTLDNISL